MSEARITLPANPTQGQSILVRGPAHVMAYTQSWRLEENDELFFDTVKDEKRIVWTCFSRLGSRSRQRELAQVIRKGAEMLLGLANQLDADKGSEDAATDIPSLLFRVGLLARTHEECLPEESA